MSDTHPFFHIDFNRHTGSKHKLKRFSLKPYDKIVECCIKWFSLQQNKMLLFYEIWRAFKEKINTLHNSLSKYWSKVWFCVERYSKFTISNPILGSVYLYKYLNLFMRWLNISYFIDGQYINKRNKEVFFRWTACSFKTQKTTKSDIKIINFRIFSKGTGTLYNWRSRANIKKNSQGGGWWGGAGDQERGGIWGIFLLEEEI